MKKALIILLALFMGITSSFSQSKREKNTAAILKAIEGKYKLDDNNNVTYVHVVEVPELSKDEIFNRAKNYFTYNYGSGKSVIQTEDSEKGILVGKGIYSKVHGAVVMMMLYSTFDVWHILRIDAKDGKARIILTLTQYDITTTGNKNSGPTHRTVDISENYPINPKGKAKTWIDVFYQAHLRAQNTLQAVEKAIKEGSTSATIENEDW